MNLESDDEALYPIFGAQFSHPDMKLFDLPDCFEDIDWSESQNRGRWMHFCLHFLPEWMSGLHEMLAEAQDLETRQTLMSYIQWLEQWSAGLREALRSDDPQLFAELRPQDQIPALFLEPEPDFSDSPEQKMPSIFGDDFAHLSMTYFGLPPRYADIDWRDPRQSRGWIAFQAYFFPVYCEAVLEEGAKDPLYPLEEARQIFSDSAEALNQMARTMGYYAPGAPRPDDFPEDDA